MTDYSGLIEYAQTDRQKEILQACIDGGSQHKASVSLDINSRNIERAVKRVKQYAASRGYSPEHDMTQTSPEGYLVKGTSTLYDDEGNKKLQWVKTSKDHEMVDDLKEAFEAFADDFKHKSIKVPCPKKYIKDLVNVIPMGDPHVGLYCWQEEVGESFDCDIAESLMFSAVDHLIKTSPAAEECLLINLGDFFHADTAAGITLRSGHKLDVDTRWNRVLEIGVRAIRRCIDRALEAHKKVTVISAIGNHDDHSAQFLNIVLREYYRNNKRVHIQDNKTLFQYYQFGKNLFGITHGHTIKPLDLEGVMARDCNDRWSETQFRKWFVGHFHSQRKHDMRNCEVEYYRTLAAGDAWSVASG